MLIAGESKLELGYDGDGQMGLVFVGDAEGQQLFEEAPATICLPDANSKWNTNSEPITEEDKDNNTTIAADPAAAEAMKKIKYQHNLKKLQSSPVVWLTALEV